MDTLYTVPACLNLCEVYVASSHVPRIQLGILHLKIQEPLLLNKLLNLGILNLSIQLLIQLQLPSSQIPQYQGLKYSKIIPIQLIPFRKLGIQVHPPLKLLDLWIQVDPPTRPGCLIESRLAIAFVWFHCLALFVVCLALRKQVGKA
ncbi:hypothetical protein SLA2020_354190 [Shorea laevis]